MKPLDSSLQYQLFTNANKKRLQNEAQSENIIYDDISEKKAMEIYDEILNIYLKHNISYRVATEISIALAHAFLIGAAELYEENEE